MQRNLPPILPTASSSSGGRREQGIGGRKEAKVSVNQQATSGRQAPVTSIASIGRVDVSDSGVRRGLDTDERKKDDLRYSQIRRMIRERKGKEGKTDGGVSGATRTKAVEQQPSPSKYKVKLGTGVTFSRKIRGGFDRTLRNMWLKHRVTFRNLSQADRTFIGDLIQKHAVHRATGVGYTWSDRRRMKEEVEKARQSGKISYEDAKDFKKIISELE